jgi:molybdopterin synthase sulfur carrier subunit
MAVVVRLPGALRDATGGTTKVEARGRTLAEIIEDLDRRYPGLKGRIVDEHGKLRTYVNVFIGERDARTSGGTGATVPEGEEVMVIPAMAGGAHST